MFLSERIAADQITITYHEIGMNEAGTHRTWSVELHRPDGRTFRLPDPWEDNNEPTVFNVLDLVTGSLNIVDQSANRREWAHEYTLDPDQAEKHFTQKHWETWQEINEGMREFLGHQGHENYLYDTDRSR